MNYRELEKKAMDETTTGCADVFEPWPNENQKLNPHYLHTDRIRGVADVDVPEGYDFTENDWTILTAEEYDRTILANCGTRTPEFGWEKDDTILVAVCCPNGRPE